MNKENNFIYLVIQFRKFGEIFYRKEAKILAKNAK